MSPDEVEGHYREAIREAGDEKVTVRRRYGTGTSRPWFDAEVPAKVARYGPKDLAGAAQQGDANVILLRSDLEAKRYPLPPRNGDTIFVDGREMSIVAVDGATRRIAGVTIAYDITARGAAVG